ncbi:protein of unknown function [Citrobacter amalonaticus]|uniref:Uncharacterized protein n=1 Tax=Citrobacter amalonaticus TaxID=35703 RepID=A0AAX2BMP5_CITAM|nr:protein of unknown function [Citrobacter amalonaticus]SBA08744.1 protein of unknown function [Citrobacter amalonaticus]
MPAFDAPFLTTLKHILTGVCGNSMPLLSKASQGREHDAAIGRKTDSNR